MTTAPSSRSPPAGGATQRAIDGIRGRAVAALAPVGNHRRADGGLARPLRERHYGREVIAGAAPRPLCRSPTTDRFTNPCGTRTSRIPLRSSTAAWHPFATGCRPAGGPEILHSTAPALAGPWVEEPPPVLHGVDLRSDVRGSAGPVPRQQSHRSVETASGSGSDASSTMRRSRATTRWARPTTNGDWRARSSWSCPAAASC